METYAIRIVREKVGDAAMRRTVVVSEPNGASKLHVVDVVRKKKTVAEGTRNESPNLLKPQEPLVRSNKKQNPYLSLQYVL